MGAQTVGSGGGTRDNGCMLRVYLDQNKWVDLARAATGHRDGVRFVDALAMCRASAAAGAASFPLIYLGVSPS